MLFENSLSKNMYLSVFTFFGRVLFTEGVLGSTINSLCTPAACHNGSVQLSTGAVLDDSTTSTLLTPGNYSRFHDVTRARANPGFATHIQQSGLTVTQLSPMIAYPLPLYQDQPQLIGEEFIHPEVTVNSFLLAKGYQATFGFHGAVILAVHDSCPNVKESNLKGLELMAVEPNNCPGGCGSGGSCSGSASTCKCNTGYTGARCDSCANGYFGPDCQRCPDCDQSTSSTCDDGTTGTGACISLDLNKTHNLFSISQNRCNCLNGICTGAASCLCSAGWTTASNGTLCATCSAGFFLDPHGECAACNPSCKSCTGPLGLCQECAQGFQPSNSTSCSPTPMNLVGASPLTSCKLPKALLSAGHVDDNNTVGASCVDVDPNTGACSSPPGSLFFFNQSKGICDPAPRLCSAATIPGFSLTQPESTSTVGAVCLACAAGALLLPDRPGGSEGKCVGICPNGTYDDSLGHCASCPTGCSTCVLGDEARPQCTGCTNPSMFIVAGACMDTCPARTFASVTANDTPRAPKGVNACLPCSASCESCSQSPTACQSCPKNRPAFDPVTQTCALACPRGTFADTNAGGRCSTCGASCETCSGAGSGDCLSCKAGDVLQEGKCRASACAGNSTQIVTDWGVCLEDLLAAKPETSSREIPAWLVVLVTILLSGTLGALCLLIWRLQQRKKRQNKTRKFGDGLATSDIKLHPLDALEVQENNRPGWSDQTISAGFDPRPSPQTPTPSEFKIKRKVVPTDVRMDDWERESVSIYSHSDHFTRVDQPGTIRHPPTNISQVAIDSESARCLKERCRTVQGSIWFEGDLGRRPSQQSQPPLGSHASMGSFK
ncbi:hypothetical protein PSTG_16390 [Puccinia striiformis f. sp. tritici PST-78]|uniref:EGF-like domain-containing protein n=1 Tax=Puccinia striiformis f. sp. tritici PST-78 TaxID=1165861 RepID=A0A0L0USX8_9BASI|nr:hypothetical protein PSTG_16390 [Puccinia striiformis f. sp. tritici PST-78]